MSRCDEPKPEDLSEALVYGELSRYLEERVHLASYVDVTDAVAQCVLLLHRTWTRGATVYIAGNGGSAAGASHMSVDLRRAAQSTARYPFVRVHSLNDSNTSLSAISNDLGFAEVFASQLQSVLGSEDLLIVLSVSGHSPNILAALHVASTVGATSVAFLGDKGSPAHSEADLPIAVPCTNYGHVEDFHLSLNHAMVRSIAGGQFLECEQTQGASDGL